MNAVPAARLPAARFREAMALVAASVHVITAGEGDHCAGTTATAVCSVSDAPPTLLVCLHREGRLHKLLAPGMPLTVNTLRGDQQPVAATFAGQDGTPASKRFTIGRWTQPPGAAPVLADALVSFLCRVDRIIEAGSHGVVLCAVHDVILHEAADALVYGARRYATLALGAAPGPLSGANASC